jgi:hypothetical protein
MVAFGVGINLFSTLLVKLTSYVAVTPQTIFAPSARNAYNSSSLVIPILWITKEIMSRGPQVADMECRETT